MKKKVNYKSVIFRLFVTFILTTPTLTDNIKEIVQPTKINGREIFHIGDPAIIEWRNNMKHFGSIRKFITNACFWGRINDALVPTLQFIAKFLRRNRRAARDSADLQTYKLTSKRLILQRVFRQQNDSSSSPVMFAKMRLNQLVHAQKTHTRPVIIYTCHRRVLRAHFSWPSCFDTLALFSHSIAWSVNDLVFVICSLFFIIFSLYKQAFFSHKSIFFFLLKSTLKINRIHSI